ncbi:MAG: oligosaccharide repeat unit polymerase [bacterium]
MFRLKIKKQISIELYLILFFIFADFIQAIVIINSGFLIGDFFPLEVRENTEKIIFLFSLQSLLYFLTYKFYLSLIKNRKFLSFYIKIDSNLYVFIDYLIFSLLLLNILFFLFVISNKAGSYNSSNISFILNIISIDAIFPIYYFLNRTNGNRFIYILNTLIYVILTLGKGWTGIIFMIFIFELYFRFKQKVHLKYLLAIPMLIIIGSFLYQLIYPLKIYIRYGTEIEPISFLESTGLLIGRLSMISNLVAIFQYKSEILSLIDSLYPINFEILKFIRVQVPSFIAKEFFPYEIFEYGTIGSILFLFKIGISYPIEGVATGFGSPLLGTLYLLFLRNPIEALLFLLFSLFVIFCIKFLLDLFKCNHIYFPFFFNLIYFIREGGEIVLAFGKIFFSLTVFVIIIILFKEIINGLKR